MQRQVKEETDRSVQQIQQTAQQAVRDAIAQERQNASAEALALRDLSDGINYAAAIRTAVTEYFAVQGRLPNDTAEVFPDGTDLPAALEKAEIGAGGRITLHFNAPKSGLKGRVVLTPDVDEKYLIIRQWDCTTPDFAFIADAAPTAATSGGKHGKANPNRAKRPSETVFQTACSPSDPYRTWRRVCRPKATHAFPAA